MDHVITWFEESLTCRLTRHLMAIWSNSLVCRGMKRMGSIIVYSHTSKLLSAFFRKRFRPKQVFVYKLLRRVCTRLLPLKLRTLGIIRASLVWRILGGSRLFGLLSRFLIPLAVFFVFIDEIGRSLFGEQTLFGVWDEVYLLACAIFLILRGILRKNRISMNTTPMDSAIFLLISVSFFLFLNYSPYPQIGFAGMRSVVQFLLWFFIFSRYLDSDKKSDLMIRGLILTGGILGIHGILQFAAGVETPSHWTDAAEGTHAVRVFSVVESPNILGSLMVLFIPLTLAWTLRKKTTKRQRACCLALLAFMGICLILTLSRGAWVGMGVALLIFCMAWNPKWITGMVFAGGMAFMIPAVSNRIRYMLSPRYIMSSITGGRLLRYKTGWEMFRENLWTGVGQGHFGGAVAMNHKDLFPDTFYMDNYWLKTAVEMGVAGLAAFFILVCSLFVWSVRALRTTMDHDRKLIITGGFSGMMGILTHNLFENVFEVPYMVVYFWMVAAIIFYHYERGRFRLLDQEQSPL